MFSDSVLGDIAKAHGKGIAQVALRWLIQQNVVPIPFSSKPERIADNLNVFDFTLSDDEMKRIAALNKIYANVARSMPRVELVHWRTLVCPGGKRAEDIGGKRVWQSDEQHLTDDGAVAVWRWWLPQVR